MKTFVISWNYSDSYLKEFDHEREAEDFIKEKLARGDSSEDSFVVLSGERKKVDIKWLKDHKYNVTIS